VSKRRAEVRKVEALGTERTSVENGGFDATNLRKSGFEGFEAEFETSLRRVSRRRGARELEGHALWSFSMGEKASAILVRGGMGWVGGEEEGVENQEGTVRVGIAVGFSLIA